MNIAILDGVVIAVVFISAVLAMFRGFVREVLSIAAWVAAAVLAYMFYEQALPYVSEYVDNRTIAVGISAAGIFLVSLIVVSLITMKISDFVMDSPVGAVDRLVVPLRQPRELLAPPPSASSRCAQPMPAA